MTVPRTTRRWGLHAGLLALWFLASFGVVFFAHDLQFFVAHWPVGFWFAAQGSVLVFIGIVVVFAWITNRREGAQPGPDRAAYAAYKSRLNRRFAAYVVCLLLFLLVLAVAEQRGLP